MSAPNPRKRPAPGATPIVPLQQMPQPYPTPAQEPVLMWNTAVPDPNTFVDPSGNIQPYIMNAQGQYGQGFQPPQSTAIARRPPNRALVPTAPRAAFDTSTDQWPNFGDDSDLVNPSSNGTMDGHDNIDALEEQAQVAKREAQAKRKQIPPFVQKLSSFLEEQKNTDLIRWSDKGDSFIVLDEDEFAKTLIPELFKHNNYASFVRQLNMYGFHKRVGLSDNSMKASERKNKSPSEYYNPYFRRGHPNLLWLINKPKSGNKSKKGKKEDGDADSEEEAGVDEAVGQGYGATAASQPSRGIPPAGEVGPLQKKDLQVVRDQLRALQHQQKTISSLINRLRQDHNALYQQALMFQNMHDRHENSINAILSFLANVFRKQLEEQGGAQSVSDLLASILPTAQMPQGSVFDLGDLGDFMQQQTPAAATMSPPRRPQRLLPPIPNTGKASTIASPASNASPAPFNPATSFPDQTGSVTELFDTPSDTTSPKYLQQELQTNPQEGMMKIIQDTNANNTSGPVNLPEVAAKTPVNLSNDQRNKIFSIMSGQTAGQNPAAAAAAAAAATAGATATRGGSSGAAAPAAPSAAPAAPSGGKPGPGSAAPSGPLSPALASLQAPLLKGLSDSQAEFEQLQRMQEEQNAKIEGLEHILGPLSPSGRITPLLDNPGYFDVDQYLDSNAYDLNTYGSADFGGGSLGPTDGSDFDFKLDGSGGFDPGSWGGGPPPGGVDGPTAAAVGGGGGDANTAPSPAGTEEIARNDLDTSPARNTKRRRMG